MTTTPEVFDRVLLARRRARAAALRAYDRPDYLLQRAADDLVDRLAVVMRKFPVAAVIGSHGGEVGARLRRSGAHEAVVDLDPVAAMLPAAPALRVQADEEFLPLRPAAFDLIASVLSLQFVNDVPGALTQMRHALKPDGLLLAAVIGGETLTELRQCLVAAESELEGGASPRVAPFADGRDFGALLQRAGFALPVVDTDRFTVAYREPLALLHDLRAMGATNVLTQRRRTPLRFATIARACRIYFDRFSRADGKVLATFEIVTLTGWAPADTQPKPLRPGSAKQRLAEALGVPEVKVRRE